MAGQFYPPNSPQKLKSIDEPWYGRVWGFFKQFPTFLSEGNPNPPIVSGEAAAAFISAAIGCVTMMITHHLSDADKSKATEKFVHSLGKWIPGSANPDPMWGNIGSYTGKETMLLVGWLVSWMVLSVLLKDKQVKAATIFFWMIGLMTLATVMCWHPIFPYLPLV
jgi:hypothetical protein